MALARAEDRFERPSTLRAQTKAPHITPICGGERCKGA
jgi:hypothetical protein